MSVSKAATDVLYRHRRVLVNGSQIQYLRPVTAP
jgi:hypothetical protein